MAARELGEVVIVVPVERGDLCNGWVMKGRGWVGGGGVEDREQVIQDKTSLRCTSAYIYMYIYMYMYMHMYVQYLVKSCSTCKLQVAIVKIKQPGLLLS